MSVATRTQFAVLNLNNFKDEFGFKAEQLASLEAVAISQVSVGPLAPGLPPLDKDQAVCVIHPKRLTPFTCRIHIFCRPQDQERVEELLKAHPLSGEVLDRLRAMVKINPPGKG